MFSRNSILKGLIHPSVAQQKECLWYICTWGTHTNNKLRWNPWKKLLFSDQGKKTGYGYNNIRGGHGQGQSESPHGEASLWDTSGNLRETVHILHSFMHSFMFKILVPAYSIKQPCFVSPVIHCKKETVRKLSNFNFQWTKTLYQNNLNNITLFFTFFNGCRYN